MAIINCPECGKEISDKALSCPNCGYPLNQSTAIMASGVHMRINDSVNSNVAPIVEDCIGCPKCGSSELHAEKQGFSGGKALVGAALTGGIGLLAGTIGSKNVNVTCIKCGNRFTAGEGKIVKKISFPDSFVMDEIVLQKLKEGSKYAAAGHYQRIHNVGNEDAIGIIEAYIKSHPWVFTEQSSSPKPNSKVDNNGCATIAVILIALGLMLSFALV